MLSEQVGAGVVCANQMRSRKCLVFIAGGHSGATSDKERPEAAG